MITPSLIAFLKRVLSSSLERLDQIEQQSPRAKKSPWYRSEIHVPPALIAAISAVLLFFTLFWSNQPSLPVALATASLVAILMGLFLYYVTHEHAEMARSDDAMALLAVVFFADLFLIKVFSVFSINLSWLSPLATPVGLAPLLVALLLHGRLAMVLSFAVATIFGILNGFSLEYMLVGAAGSLAFVANASKARTAHDVARAGFFVGLLQGLVVVFLAIYRHWENTATWLAMASALVSGVLAAALCLGALPFLESFFSQTSNLRLLELSDVNHPLLRRMSLEAPGTYHHSLIVASLAEDAANAIGANGLLCRVGAYFHDIGKMVKPEYFIENQGSLGNPHDQVSPSLSRLVITSHVKEGMALAKEYKLATPVLNFIPQHHGTSKIEYFYQKAVKLEEQEDDAQREEVSVDTYRYPGPKPQSKEAGIIMMADSVEAASRTLEEPNHQRYKDLVFKIVNKKLFDGLLDETPLSLKDLRAIADRFTATLTSIHHARIPYPETDPSGKKEKHESFSPPVSERPR